MGQSRAGTQIFWRYSEIPKNRGRYCDNQETFHEPKNARVYMELKSIKKLNFGNLNLSNQNILSRTLKPISICLDFCQNAVFKTLKEHWICLKFTKIKSFPGAQWLRIHEPNQRKSFHTFPNQIVKFSKIDPGSLNYIFWNTRLISLGRIPNNDYKNSRSNKIICFQTRMLQWIFWTFMSIGSNICITP